MEHFWSISPISPSWICVDGCGIQISHTIQNNSLTAVQGIAWILFAAGTSLSVRVLLATIQAEFAVNAATATGTWAVLQIFSTT